MRQIVIITLAIFIAGGGATPRLLAQVSNANDCAAKLTTFVRELDDLLRQRPHDLTVISGFLHRHIPVSNCTIDAASEVMKTSAYFKGEERVKANDPIFIRQLDLVFARSSNIVCPT